MRTIEVRTVGWDKRIARTGPRSVARCRPYPKGAEFGSPGRSAAQPWVDDTHGIRKPQRGAIPAEPRAAPLVEGADDIGIGRQPASRLRTLGSKAQETAP
jgi:hypothetical protein